MLNKIKTSFALKVSLIVFAFIFIVAIIVGSLSLFFYQRDLLTENANTAQMIAVSVVAGIDGDEYEVLAESFEKNDYWDELEALFSETKTQTDAMYLYGLNNDADGSIKYVVDGMKPSDDPGNIGVIGESEEAGTYAEETFVALGTGLPTTSGVYQSGDYGAMVSGFAPILNSQGNVVGVVGVDISLESVMDDIWSFAFRTFGIALGASLVFGIIVIFFINRKVGAPIKLLLGASEQIAEGDTEIELAVTSKDEIGQLTGAFIKMSDSIRQQVKIIQVVAKGDYTVSLPVRSDKDEMNICVYPRR